MCCRCCIVFFWLVVVTTTTTTCEAEWVKDSDGMLIVKNADEMKHFVQESQEPLWLTWVEDTTCNASQTISIQESIRTSVEILASEFSIPTIRYTLSEYADRKSYSKIKETPTLFVSTMNETARYSVEYSGSYHDIPNTVAHYRDWLTKWSISRYHPDIPSITLEESIPKFFASKEAIWEYWHQEYTNSPQDPLLIVYYQPNVSLCEGTATTTPRNATKYNAEREIFEWFAITVAGRRDRYFFYSHACQRQLHVYQDQNLLYEYNETKEDVRMFLVQSISDAMLTFHREKTAPIAMAHDIHIVSTFMLEQSWCEHWKRKRRSLVCLYVPDHEHRLIHMLGLMHNRVVIVDENQRTHAQPEQMSWNDFVEETVFRRHTEPSPPPPPIEYTGTMVWIEESGVGLPETGIVVAVARTCGHCQRMLAILYRLEGLLETLGWTDRFPLYVVDVTKTDVVQPYWLPTLYHNGVECPKRSFQDETEILEWVFGQMKDDQIIALQQSM